MKYNIFFKGRVDRSTLKKYYLNSVGMICLGYDETFCLNIIEAYSCGLPVISFGFTAVDEITDKKNSFIMNDYSDFYKIFLSILYLKPTKRKNMIKYCVNYSKKFYLKNIMNKWLKILNL